MIFEETHTAYDKASNVIHTTTKERWHDATGNGALNGPNGSQPKSRDSYVALLYDGIGRNIATANYGTNNYADPPSWPTTVPSSTATRLVSQTTYNTKGEAEYQTDPAGKITRTIFDAAGRVTSTTRNQLSSPQEKVEMTYTPDGQLATLTAVNTDTGNQVTTYSYGVTLTGSGIASNALLASVDYPDGGDVLYEYNRQGQRIKLTDQNNTVHEYEYDKLGRQTADKVTTVGGTVDDDVRRIAWSYDNRKRLQKVTSFDAVSSGNETSDVEFEYNSFNQPVTEYQQHGAAVNTGTSPKVEYGYSSSNNTIRRTSCTYPDTTVLAFNYGAGANNAIGRPEKLYWSGADVATYQYLGLGQVVIQKYVQPTFDVEYTLAGGSSPNPYTGLDRFGRIIELKWKQPATTLVHLKYGYDLASNRTYRRDEVARSVSAKFDERYLNDGLNRLYVATRGELNSNNDGLVGSPTFAQAWTLDATGNWKNLSQVGPDLAQGRTHNVANEITAISTDFGTPIWDTPPGYDHNGNMTEMPSPLDVAIALGGTYDAWNRLVATDGGTTVVEYAYDGMNRRITKTSGGTTRRYYYSDQWQVLEERLNASSSADRQYVWGLRYIDDLVLRDTPSERLYALQDGLFNVVALTNTSGAVVERFAYQPYGQSEPLDPDYTAYSGTDYGWTYRFTGRELDLETGLQINRMRYLHLQLGRWLTRDPIGYLAGINLFRYVSSKATNHVDPWGISEAEDAIELGFGFSYYTYKVVWESSFYRRRREVVDYEYAATVNINIAIGGRTTSGNLDSATIARLRRYWFLKPNRRDVVDPYWHRTPFWEKPRREWWDPGFKMLCRKAYKCHFDCKEISGIDCKATWTRSDAFVYGYLVWDNLAGRPYCHIEIKEHERALISCVLAPTEAKKKCDECCEKKGKS